MAITALDIKDKTFKLKFRGYDEEEVNEFLDIVVDDYEDLVRRNHEQENRIKDLEDKLAYFDEMKESLSQSVIETEELKRQSRVFHQRLLAAVEGQLSLASAPEWGELLQPTAIYLQNSDAAFKEVVEKVLEEEMPETDDEMSMDATRQFTPEEMEELQRRVEAGNKHLEETQKLPVIDDSEADDINLNETQTFKLNIEE